MTRSIVIVLGLLMPVVATAQVRISEIMYDLSGSDSGREWIEVVNEGSTEISLEEWIFYENDTNHGLTYVSGDVMLAAGTRAVIADDADVFLSDWSGFSGVLFDSSFSLKNTDEMLILRDSEGNDVDSVSYTSDWGAEGDGNSLQFVAGEWYAYEPTPGAESTQTTVSVQKDDAQEEDNDTQGADNDTSIQEAQGGGGGPVVYTPPGRISADAGSNRTVMAGADVVFEGKAFGLEGKPLEGAYYSWSFGDGSVADGQKVLHHFAHPGTYIVYLSVSSGQYGAGDKIEVDVIPSAIEIAEVTGEYIALTNTSSHELNIELWQIHQGGNFFTLPAHTYIPAQKTMYIDHSISGLSNARPTHLLYPNNALAYSFAEVEKDDTHQMSNEVRTASQNISSVRTPPTLALREQKIKEEEDSTDLKQKEIQATSSQAAAVAQALPSEHKGTQSGMLWYGALAGITFLALFGLYFIRKMETRPEDAESIEYEIIEYEEK